MAQQALTVLTDKSPCLYCKWSFPPSTWPENAKFGCCEGCELGRQQRETCWRRLDFTSTNPCTSCDKTLANEDCYSMQNVRYRDFYDPLEHAMYKLDIFRDVCSQSKFSRLQRCRACQFVLRCLEACYTTLDPRVSARAFHPSVSFSLDLNNAPQLLLSAPFTRNQDYDFTQLSYFEVYTIDFDHRHRQSSFPRFLPWLSPADKREQICGTLARLLTDCRSRDDHAACCKSRKASPDFSPKRVIDLGSKQPILRENIVVRSYACLSYCWGAQSASLDELHATTRNLPSLLLGISWNSLPQLFQDVIHICRQLGIRYLWVDRLCIVQDDELDWDDQAVQMASIYACSELTFAAVASPDPTVGLFRQNAISPPGIQVQGFSDLYIRQYGIRTSQPAQIDLGPQPLYSRAWAFQEQQLAPRKVTIGAQQITWHCVSKEYAYQAKAHSGLVNRICTLTELSEFKQSARSDLWCRIVQEYSRLDLTYERDRLPALSAVAQIMQADEQQDRYLLGMWESDLIIQLTWYIDHAAGPTSKRGIPSVNATWSWVSAAGGVSWLSSGAKRARQLQTARVLDVDIEHLGSSYLGRARRAGLFIGAPFLKAHLIRSSAGQQGIVSSVSPTRITKIGFNGLSLDRLDCHPVEEQFMCWKLIELRPDLSHFKYHGEVVFLFLGHVGTTCTGIALRPKTSLNSHNGVYERFGMFKIVIDVARLVSQFDIEYDLKNGWVNRRPQRVVSRLTGHEVDGLWFSRSDHTGGDAHTMEQSLLTPLAIYHLPSGEFRIE